MTSARRQLTYSVGSPADPDAIIGPVEVRGALASLQDVREPPAAGQDALAAQMATWVRESAADPEVLGLPDYGVPWVPPPRTRTLWAGCSSCARRARAHPRRHRTVERHQGPG